jgi:hypothetical protein
LYVARTIAIAHRVNSEPSAATKEPLSGNVRVL